MTKERDESARQVDTLTSERDALSAEVDSLRRETAEIRSKLASASNWGAWLASAETAKASAEANASKQAAAVQAARLEESGARHATMQRDLDAAKASAESSRMSLSNAETRLAASTERERALEAEVARCRADRLASERRERDACAERDTLKGQLELMMTKATTHQQPPALNLKSSAGGVPSSRSHANGDSSARAKSTARALLLHGGAAGV